MAEKQRKIIRPHEGMQNSFVRSNVDVCFSGGVLNCGKSLTYNELVLSPNGWVRFGDLCIGDIIMNPNGSKQYVVGIYEQGLRDVYEFTFADGTKARSDIEHLWSIYDNKFRGNLISDEFIINKVVTTKDIINKIDNGFKVNIPTIKEFSIDNTIKYNIHPYLLGVLIGDGCITDKYVRISIFDLDIADRIKQFGYDIRQLKHNEYRIGYMDTDIHKELDRLGLWGKHSYEKRLPKDFELLSLEDKKYLLQGLMDTDGHTSLDKKSVLKYDTTSYELAIDIQRLVHSIGGVCNLYTNTTRKYKIKNGEERNGRPLHTLHFRTHNNRSLVYTKRKLDKVDDISNSRCHKYLHRQIISYKYVGKEQCRCIKVSDDNNLFIIDNYIVTHNTAGAVLLPAEWLLIPTFSALYMRKLLGESVRGGGMVREFEKFYGSFVKATYSDPIKVVAKTGATIDFSHVADENADKVLERFKGGQWDLIYLDELTAFSFDTFKTLMTRNRGDAGIGSKFRGTTNPKKSHWIRKWLDWYIGEDGLIMPERDGVVRYFVIAGEDVDSVVWGSTKEEVYEKCKPLVDTQVAALGNDFCYKDIIKSFVFYKGNMSENKASIGRNKGYAGSVSAMGAKKAKILLEGNWNVDEDEDNDSLPIPTNSANAVFSNDPQTNNDWWITVDLAGQGKDNTIMIVWNGFHIMDVMMLNISDAQGNATACKVLAEKWNIAHSRIIFDATNGMYFKSYIPEARPFMSRNSARGLYKTTYQYMKDECAYRLTEMIKGGYISFSEKVATMQYKHQKLTSYTTVKTEFIQECYALRFKDKGNGKRALYTKVEMNAILGKGRSMDLLDPCIMRMMPIVSSVIGEEIFWDIDDRIRNNNNDSFQTSSYGTGESIYDLLED